MNQEDAGAGNDKMFCASHSLSAMFTQNNIEMNEWVDGEWRACVRRDIRRT